MIVTAYLKMDRSELEDEISKQKKKIESAKETIRLLRKLQIAADAEAEKKKDQHAQSSNPTNANSSISTNQQNRFNNHGTH